MKSFELLTAYLAPWMSTLSCFPVEVVSHIPAGRRLAAGFIESQTVSSALFWYVLDHDLLEVRDGVLLGDVDGDIGPFVCFLSRELRVLRPGLFECWCRFEAYVTVGQRDCAEKGCWTLLCVYYFAFYTRRTSGSSLLRCAKNTMWINKVIT